MPYFTWDKLKMPLDLDGSVILWNGGLLGPGAGGFSSPMFLATTAEMAQVNGESPAKDTDTSLLVNTSTSFVVVLFPELRDLTAILVRWRAGANLGTITYQTSTDTTNGMDGTWNTVTTSGTTQVSTANADWWRANAPGTFTGANITSIKALRFSQVHSGGAASALRGLHLFGKKSSGQTVDDILFLDPDGSTVSTVDYDYGDVGAGGVTSDVTVYVKNASATKTANNVALSFSGSNTGDFLMSIDGGSNFFTTRLVASLAPAATQAIVVRVTTPAIASGVATPRAANLRAAVGTWT